MWRYVVVNSLWFSILFFVHFFGSKKDQRIVLTFIFALAAYLALRSPMDPFAWFFYFVFSCVVFYGSGRFRRWAYAGQAVMEEEIHLATKTLEKERQLLGQKTHETRALEAKAREIVEFFEKVKEMSRCLESLETFLVFGEALAAKFQFRAIKLALFGQENADPARPEEVYEIEFSDFEGLYDRAALLKDKKKAKGPVFPFDEKIFREVFKAGKPSAAADTDSMAYPVFIHEKITAVLILVGINAREAALLAILVERFISELQRVKLYERVQTLATTDGLTGVYVRRHLLERLESEVERSKKFNLKLSFLMIDVDYFKRFNDTYGHLVGDVVLRETAQTIKGNIREVDLAGRYGGEEFATLLIETGEAVAHQVAERIRRSVEEKIVRAYDENLKVTVSIGCSTFSPGAGGAARLVETADEALYRAKKLGRNRVCIAANGK